MQKHARHIMHNVINKLLHITLLTELSCHPLTVDDEFATISCPNGYSFGSTCFLGCNHNYPLIGDFNVTCQQDINDDTKVFWDWTNNTISYCEKLGK